MSVVESNSQSTEDAVARRNPRRAEAVQLTPNDDEEEVVHSLGMAQPRPRKPILVALFLAIVVVAPFAVIVRWYSVESQPQAASNTEVGQTPEIAEDPLSTISPDCPPPSTKDADSKFFSEDLKIAGCHRMECLSERPLQNTRDRLSYNAPLCSGQALCNGDDEKFPGVLFQFGLTLNGALVWQKCDSNNPSQTEIITLRSSDKEIVYAVEPDHNEHTNATAATTTTSSVLVPPKNKCWFQMTPDATWQIFTSEYHDSDQIDSTTEITANATVVWEQPVQNRPRPVLVTPRCLSNRPVLDCPYIHFRRHGDIIMNFIDKQDGWVACKSRKICYPDLWE